MGKSTSTTGLIIMNKKLIQWIEEYVRGLHGRPIIVSELAAWIKREKRWEPSQEEMMTLLMRHLARAMRTQYATDPEGRRVRRKHALKTKEKDAFGKQLVLWYDMDIAQPQFMQGSLQQRRGGLADGCWQLKQDQDSFNQYYNKAAPIELSFDFNEDNEERAQSGYQSPDDDDPADE